MSGMKVRRFVVLSNHFAFVGDPSRAVVCRIRILESTPAGYLDFFGLDWISFSFQQDSDPDYPNEIKSGRAKILVWNNSCMRKNYDLSKSYTKNILYLSDFSR